MSAAVLPVVLYPRNPTLHGWERTEGEALASLVCCQPSGPAQWLNLMSPSKGGKVWVKINDKWREGEIIAEGKVMNKWVMQRGKSNILLIAGERLRARE